MAESEILKLQDKDGDLLIDVCKDLVPVVGGECEPCIKNPYASLPNWKDLDIDSPFFNERECKYQVSVVTRYSQTIDSELFGKATLTEEEAEASTNERFREYAEVAVESILTNNGKNSSELSRNTLLSVVNYEQFYLDPRPNSRLILLYSVPYIDLQNIADDDGSDDNEDDPEDTDDETTTGGSSVTYNATEIKPKIIRVRKALRLYSKYLVAFRALDSGNILFESNNGVFNLANYGDSGNFSKSALGAISIEIDSFLSARGFNIVGVGGGSVFQQSVDKLEFTFNQNYKLINLDVYSSGCGSDRPIRTFGKRKLKSLNKKDAFKDKTALAYFVNLSEMENELQSRSATDWKQFLIKYTYPTVYSTTDPILPSPNSLSCVADILATEGKQLGQNLVDSTFSIGDAIAARFRQNICLNEVGELEEEDQDLGINVTPDVDRASKTILEMATEQAFATMEDEDQVFASLCAGILNVTGTSNGFSSFSLEDIWKDGLDKIRLCGMFDLLIETSNCLMKGLSFEEAAGSIVKAALRGMSMENLTDFFTNVLPSEDRAKIEDMANQKIMNGNVFPDQGLLQDISNSMSGSSVDSIPSLFPATSPNVPTNSNLDGSNSTSDIPVEGNQSSPSRAPTNELFEELPRSDRQTLLTQAKFYNDATHGADKRLNRNVLVQAYIQAVVDYYSGQMLFLLNKLNKYPGAHLIGKAVTFLDCPQDPIMNPTIPDFMKSVKLPECGTPFEIVAPKFQNPFGWIPEVTDFSGILFELLRKAMTELMLKILIQMLSKLCKLLGSSLCTGLSTIAGMGANAVAGTGYGSRDTFKEVIRSSICGQDADMNQVNATINDLFEKLGLDPTALANQERVDEFVGDISSSTTQSEFMSAVLGNPSPEFLQIIDYLIEYEYSEFRGNVNNKQAIGDLFENLGNLMPVDLRAAMADELAQAPQSQYPANPTLCATEEDLEDFCERRAALLSGRATAAQAALMCEEDRNRLKNDLDEINDLIHSGIPAALTPPPIVSDPGCENGLIPFETEEMTAASTTALSRELKKIKFAYTTDFIGNGPGQSRWGMLNMIMSDTLGNPLTAHNRKNFFQNRYVDFYVEGPSDNDGRVPTIQRQRGAYPAKVGEWLQYQLNDSFDELGVDNSSDLHESLNFSSNNNVGDKETSLVSFETLGLTSGLYNSPNINLYSLPDLGVFSDVSIKWETQQIKFIRKARKSTEDMKLVFKDNAKGYRYGQNSQNSAYSYGFDISVFFSEMHYRNATTNTLSYDSEKLSKKIFNIKSDNVRLLINKNYNPGAKIVSPAAAADPNDSASKIFGNDNDESRAFTERYDEIFYSEETLNNLQEENYPNFVKAFANKQSYLPQVLLLKDLINNGGLDIETETIKEYYDTLMNEFTKQILFEIGSNEAAFNYGAEFDNLTEDDTEYVLGPGYRDSGIAYGEAEVESEDEDGNVTYRKIVNDDMILGISRMQYQIENEGREDTNRVFYLDPSTFGGTFMSPPVYISPLKNQGWMGMIDVLFPEVTHCKNNPKTDLVNFSEIEDIMTERLPNIPYDDRLKATDKSCVMELAYNKLLQRDSAAAIEGILIATVRVFITSHILRSLATFSKFKIDFPNVFSGIYAAYIVEDMEKVLSGADDDSEENLSLFKDDEFWYAFLEQAVQTYARNVDSGTIPQPTEYVMGALRDLNRNQSNFPYPSKQDLKEQKDLGRVKKSKLLRNYRDEKNLNSVYRTRNSAKRVLAQMVIDEMNKMAPSLQKNLETIGIKTEIDDMAGYMLNNYVHNSTIDLSDDNYIETSTELPSEPGLENQYTNGQEFSVYEVRDEESGYSKGDVYVGYYHTHLNVSGDLLYMAGDVHSELPHNLLKPFSTKMIVPIGDCANFGDRISSDVDVPFYLEKYTKINDEKFSPDEASQIILDNDLSLNISDVYPGTIRVLRNENDVPIGLSGKLGVRHGLSFSIIVDGEPVELTSVELDALDTTIGKFAPLEGNSKLLLCLINLLKDDEVFMLLHRYIFPLNKLTSIAAIYNGMAFIPSIGEVTVADNNAFGALSTSAAQKPGMRASFEEVENADGSISTQATTEGTAGWVSYTDRQPGFLGGLFVTEWDSWDQNVLQRTKKAVKRSFRGHYNFVRLTPGQWDMPDVGQIFLSNLRERLKPPAGKAILPWWKRSKFRNNPFDSEGNICEKE